MDTEAAGQELKGGGYTVAATAHAVDSGTKHSGVRIRELAWLF